MSEPNLILWNVKITWHENGTEKVTAYFVPAETPMLAKAAALTAWADDHPHVDPSEVTAQQQGRQVTDGVWQGVAGEVALYPRGYGRVAA